MARLTHNDALGLREVLEINGDFLLLPDQERMPYEELHALQVGGMIPVDGSTIADAVLHVHDLQPAYDRYRIEFGSEPAWIVEKPTSVQKYLRITYALTQEDPLSIVGMFPFTGLTYMVREGGLCEAVARACNLWRLNYVKQLGFLQAPWLKDRLYDMRVSNHTRFLHSLDVMAIATMIGYNNDLSPSAMHTLRMAAFTHDMGTPAGGDSVKLVDLPTFDEDENYARLLALVPVEPVLEKYDIDKATLIETILNRGILGQILDVADKLAYTARDLRECMPYIDYVIEHGEADEGLGMRTVKRLSQQFPNICGVWDAAEIRGDQLVFTDVGRLIAFLKARVIMFRELYYHPDARFGEYLVSRVLVKSLYKRGVLTRDMLLSMTDAELEQRVDKEFGHKEVIQGTAKATPRCKTFRTPLEAEAFLAKLKESGNPFALLEDNVRGIKTGAKFLVHTSAGPLPLSEAYPGDARELEEMATLLPAIHVYWLEGEPPISKKKLAALLKHS